MMKLIGFLGVAATLIVSTAELPAHARARPVNPAPSIGYDLAVLSARAQDISTKIAQFQTQAICVGAQNPTLLSLAQQLSNETGQLATQASSMSQNAVHVTLENIRIIYFKLQLEAQGRECMNRELGRDLLIISSAIQQMGYYVLPDNPNWDLNNWKSMHAPYWIGLPCWDSIGWGSGWSPLK
jgi:hypothetical protein